MQKIWSRTKRGFTLIELLVVIAIIGILSAVVLASLNDARLKARDAKRISDIKQLQLALELYYDANGSYPAATTALASAYISTVPKDPVGGATAPAYPYDQLTSGTSYHIGANLEQSTNQVLQSDGDTTSTSFTAVDDTTGCAGEANRYCYDVRP